MPASCQAVVSTSGFPFLGKKRTLANIRTVANPSCALMFIGGCGIERSVGQLCIAQKKKKKGISLQVFPFFLVWIPQNWLRKWLYTCVVPFISCPPIPALNQTGSVVQAQPFGSCIGLTPKVSTSHPSLGQCLLLHRAFPSPLGCGSPLPSLHSAKINPG